MQSGSSWRGLRRSRVGGGLGFTQSEGGRWKGGVERVIFHVDMNAFFASVEQRYNPFLRGKPIVVCGNAKKRTVVAACSYEAKAHGVKNGMSVHEARALCPNILLVGGNPEKYVEISQRIFSMLEEISPQVELFSIDEAFLDMTGTWFLFGQKPEEAARLIKRRILAGWGLTCSVGVGPNKLLAKLASGMQKPDGLVRIREEEVAGLLERLPVEELCGVGEKLKAHLHELGIFTCGQLGRAPEEALVERFGVIGRLLKRMGQGVDDSPVAPCGAEAPVKSMGHAYTLPRDTWSEEEIRGTLLRLSEQVGRRLRADGYLGRTVSLTVRYADFSSFSHQRTIPDPTDAGLVIYRVALELLNRYGLPLAQPVRLLGVGVSNLSRGEYQRSLFQEEEQLRQVDRGIDHVSDRFGEWTVVRAGALAPLVSKSHGFLVKQNRRGLILR